jgi:O-antigen/teichoic acid export membrane protein
VVELFAFRLLVRPPLLQRSSLPLRTLLSYSAPLFLTSMALRLLTEVDLLLVQARAGTAAAGWYSAAQNLSLIPLGFLGVAVSSPLLSTLSRLRGQQNPEARALVTQAIRFLLCLVPFAALVAGAAPQIVQLLYGPTYLPTSPMLAWLVFGALALTVVAVCGSLLTAAGRPGWTLPLIAPLLPAAALTEWALIPRYGAVSAATATSVAAMAGALACLAGVAHIWQVRLPLRTITRSALVAVMAFALGALWPAAGAALLLKLVLACATITVGFLLLGELTRDELCQLRALTRRDSLKAFVLRRTTRSDAQQAMHRGK